MARISVALSEFDTTHDVSSNPEILFMLGQDDESECDVTESLWLSGCCCKNKNSFWFKNR